jgi:hypothetical protein
MVSIISSFFERLEKKLSPSPELDKVLVTPLIGQTRTILQGVQAFAERKEKISDQTLERIAKSIEGRLSVMQKAKSLEAELKTFLGEDTTAKILFKKNCVWIPGQQMELAKLNQQALSGAVDEESFNRILGEVQKIAQAKSIIDRALGRIGSNDLFFATPFDISASPQKALLDAAMLETKEKKDLLDPLACYDDNFLSIELDIDALGSDLEGSDSASQPDTLSTCDLFSSEEILDLDDDAFDEKKALMQQAVIAFRQEYEDDVVEHVLKKMGGADFSLAMLKETADKVIEEHQNQQDSFFSWLENAHFSKQQIDYAFYNKMMWPGYEDRGEFSLLDPSNPENGPLFTLGFTISDAVCEKFAEAALEAEKILSENITTINDLADWYDLDESQVLKMTVFWDCERQRNNKGAAYIPPKPLTEGDIAWIENVMTNMAATS